MWNPSRLVLAASLWLAILAAVAAGGKALAQGAEPAPALPAALTVSVPAQSVLEAGDQMARMLATNKQVPADLDIVLDRVRVPVTAGQCFLLFCDFLAQVHAAKAYPESTPLERAPIQAMAGDEPAEPIAEPPTDGQGPAVQTSRLLAQCRPAAEMIRRTHTLPGGIWVQGRRLRPPEFLGAMATILQQLRYFGVLPDLVAVHPYQPPPGWAEAAAAAAAAPTKAAPVAAAQPVAATAPPPAVPPSLRLMPTTGQVVKGEIPITVIYHGPKAFLRVAIDGKVAAVSNVSPFTFVWDTRLDAEGAHTVAAEAVAGGQVVAKANIAVTAKNGGPAL